MHKRMQTFIPNNLWIDKYEQNRSILTNKTNNKYETKFQWFSAHNKLQENDKFLPQQIGATNLGGLFSLSSTPWDKISIRLPSSTQFEAQWL